jgi:hypothetical protein
MSESMRPPITLPFLIPEVGRPPKHAPMLPARPSTPAPTPPTPAPTPPTPAAPTPFAERLDALVGVFDRVHDALAGGIQHLDDAQATIRARRGVKGKGKDKVQDKGAESKRNGKAVKGNGKFDEGKDKGPPFYAPSSRARSATRSRSPPPKRNDQAVKGKGILYDVVPPPKRNDQAVNGKGKFYDVIAWKGKAKAWKGKGRNEDVQESQEDGEGTAIIFDRAAWSE